MNSEIDVRPILPSIRVPTFIIHRQGDVRVNVEAGRFMARQIPNAKYLELPGSDHMLWTGETERVLDEVEEFLTGSRSAIESDRVLATVLFTDIVNSTKRAETIGDRAWHDVLDRHNALVRREISRHRGHEVRTMGDGFLATFDGPARSIRCALAINEGVEALGLQVRAGLHTGEVEMADDDLSGIAVHIASRVATMAKPGQVLVSNTVRDLVAGSNIRFHDEGSHSLKGLQRASDCSRPSGSGAKRIFCKRVCRSALEDAFQAALSDQPAGAQAIRIIIKLVGPNDCSLCDGDQTDRCRRSVPASSDRET